MTPASVWSFDAIGTAWRIETESALPDAARAEITQTIEQFDRAWSRFRGDSLVSALALGARSVPAPPDAGIMLDAYAALSAATDGAVNPLIGDALARRGYDADYSFADRGAEAAPADWQTALTWTAETLTLDRLAMIDVGALGKGRLVDAVLAIVERAADGENGDIVVDASGDLVMRGGAQRIGLEHPFDPRRVIGVWEVTDRALCASAINRRAWGEGLHHVLDARTGQPVRKIAATWAMADTTMAADAIATALFFDGGTVLAAEWGVQWVRMSTDGRVEWSPGCTALLFHGDSVEQ